MNPLRFIENDRGALNRFMIRFLLSRWDGHLKHIPPECLTGKTVLDACCGNPRIVSWMRAMGADTFGCDISMTMLTMGGRRKYSYVMTRRVDMPVVTWVQADSERMPFADGTFDVVTCFQALHHMDAYKFISECRRVLKPGGTLIITDPNGGHFLRKMGNMVGARMGLLSPDESALVANEIEKAFTINGFTVTKRTSINFFSEILFLYEEICRSGKPLLSALIRASLFLFYPLDSLLDATLFRIFPSLAWRMIFMGEKR